MEARHVAEGNVRASFHHVKILAADERLLLAQALWARVDAFLAARPAEDMGACVRACVRSIGCRSPVCLLAHAPYPWMALHCTAH